VRLRAALRSSPSARKKQASAAVTVIVSGASKLAPRAKTTSPADEAVTVAATTPRPRAANPAALSARVASHHTKSTVSKPDTADPRRAAASVTPKTV
jgi:hypothetical protein